MRLPVVLFLMGLALVSAQYYPQNVQNPNNPNANNNYNNNNNNNGNNMQNLQNVNNRNQNYPQNQNFAGQNPSNNPQAQNPNNNPQMQNQYYQNQYQSGQQYQRPGGFVNTVPLMNTFPSGPNQTGALITLQLQSYQDPGFRLPSSNGGNQLACICPRQDSQTCPYLRTLGPQCYFSFTTIVSAPDTSVQYIATEFVPLDNNGNVDLTRSTANWSTPQTLYLSSKPSAIDIFVHHLGVVIDQSDASLKFFNNLVHVDTFVQSLQDTLPGLTSQTPTPNSANLVGRISQTALKLTYSVQCLNNYVGPNCDMTCTQSSSNSNNAVCYSNVTGFYSICSYQNGQQVSNCQPCQNGVTSDGQCQGTITTASASTNDYSAFRTWTIVLGCLLGLALIFIIALIIFIIVMHNREREPAYRSPPPPSNTWKQGAARPLLSDPYPSKVDQNSQDWGYQPHVVSVNNQRSAPIADHEASHHSHSTNDDQNSHSSYANARTANGNPVALARREAQV